MLAPVNIGDNVDHYASER